MSLLDILNPVKALADTVGSIIGRFVTDPTEKAKLQAEVDAAQAALTSKAMDLQSQLTDAQSKVIVAEAQSQSWIARNWRPILMLTFTFAFAWNNIIAPIFSLQVVPLSPDAWTLMKIGVGGYIVGRSAESVAKNWPNGNGGN